MKMLTAVASFLVNVKEAFPTKFVRQFTLYSFSCAGRCAFVPAGWLKVFYHDLKLLGPKLEVKV
jgi:hypothetical protein